MVMKMRGVRYSLRPEMRRRALRPAGNKTADGEGQEEQEQEEEQEGGAVEIGLIAQEVEEVVPEVVSTDTESGFKAVAYSRLVPVLIEAVKEQQLQLVQQRGQLEEQRQSNREAQQLEQQLEQQQRVIHRQATELEELRSAQAAMVKTMEAMMAQQKQQEKQLASLLMQAQL
jgi:hypothetical protein